MSEEKYQIQIRVVKTEMTPDMWRRFKVQCAIHEKPIRYVMRRLVETWVNAQEKMQILND